MRIATAALAACIALAGAAPARAADAVIIASNAESLPKGAVIDGDAPLELASGARVTLVTEHGDVVELAGPFAGAPAPKPGDGEAALVGALAELVRSEPRRRVPGAIRGGDAREPPAELGLVPVARSGERCVAHDAAPRFWRGDARSETELVIAHAQRRASARVAWPAGEDTLAWPPTLPVDDGASYFVRSGPAAQSRLVTLHRIPSELPTDAHRAAWMATRCPSQARAALDALRSPTR